jgi:NADH-quinone oxidoreductase subunit M
VVLGTMKVSFWYTFLAATTLIFGAAYTLWMVKRVIYGAVGNDHVAGMLDVGKRELTFLVILAVAVLALGLYPKPFADVMNPTIQELLRHVAQSKL